MLFLKWDGSPALTLSQKRNMMRKSAYLLAILVAAVSTAAVAKDPKQDKRATAPAVSATQMTDAEMDKVTAGEAPNQGGHTQSRWVPRGSLRKWEVRSMPEPHI
jgi:hypothetical protein